MKFVADGMLGKLTRWLRLAGKDVVCINDYSIPPEGEDEFLLDLAGKDSRILLTRDVNLYRQAIKNDVKSVLIEESEDIALQLIEVSESVEEDVDIDLNDSRCPVCNGELELKDKTQICDEVPETVLEKNERFWRCRECGKVYWPGSHWEKITETVERYENLR